MEYATVLDRLNAIEEDLAKRQNSYETAAGNVHRLIRDFELRLAQTKATAKGNTETAKKDAALIAIAASNDSLYADLTAAESSYEAQKAAIRVLESRLSVGQSILRAMSREATQTGQQPSWSNAA